MGLVRASPGPMGRDRLCPARHVAPLEPDPGGPRRVDGPGPSHRGHGRRAPAPGRDATGLEDGPAGHGDPSGHEGRPGDVRPGGQALPSHRRALSAEGAAIAKGRSRRR